MGYGRADPYLQIHPCKFAMGLSSIELQDEPTQVVLCGYKSRHSPESSCSIFRGRIWAEESLKPLIGENRSDDEWDLRWFSFICCLSFCWSCFLSSFQLTSFAVCHHPRIRVERNLIQRRMNRPLRLPGHTFRSEWSHQSILKHHSLLKTHQF